MARESQARANPRSCGARSSTASSSSTRARSMRNPVMFVVECRLACSRRSCSSGTTARPPPTRTSSSDWWLLFLWFTVLFANFAEAVAEGRGKAQADTLRKTRSETLARRRRPDGTIDEVPSTTLDVGDECVVTAGEVIPSDGEVIEGIAQRRRVGDHRRVGAGHPRVGRRPLGRDGRHPGAVRRDRRAHHGSCRRDVPRPDDRARRGVRAQEDARTRSHSTSCWPGSRSSSCSRPSPSSRSRSSPTREQTVVVLVALLVCLIPTTIGALLSAIGIAGMDRLVRRNVLAMSGPRRRGRRRLRTLLLDKTGTITFGNREADAFIPANGVTEQEFADAAQLSSLADETPEGRSIVVFAEGALRDRASASSSARELVPFTAQTRMSGVDMDGRSVRKGAADSVRRWVEEQGGTVPARTRRHGRLDRGAGRNAARRRRGRRGGGPPTVRVRWASSTSRTSSSPASPSASPTFVAWASARS